MLALPEDVASRNSTLRERIVEHVFVGEALRTLWNLGVTDVEVLRSEFDAGGYDIVMGFGDIVRHVQFKTMSLGGRRAHIDVNLKLADKPSGCVVWIVITQQLSLDSFLWFGGEPGAPLPRIGDLKVTRHTRGNAAGTKTERPNHRRIPKRYFEKLPTIDAVLERMFGPLPTTATLPYVPDE